MARELMASALLVAGQVCPYLKGFFSGPLQKLDQLRHVFGMHDDDGLFSRGVGLLETDVPMVSGVDLDALALLNEVTHWLSSVMGPQAYRASRPSFKFWSWKTV